MKTKLLTLACLAIVEFARGELSLARSDVLTLDGTILNRVRFVSIVMPARQVFLVHSRGVGNLSRDLFAESDLADIPTVVVDSEREAKSDSSPPKVIMPLLPLYAKEDWRPVLRIKSDGYRTSPAFKVGPQWRVRWSATGPFDVYFYDVAKPDGGSVEHFSSKEATTTGVSFSFRAGRYFLTTITSAKWEVVVEELSLEPEK